MTRLLLADADERRAKRLSEALAAQGFRVDSTVQGAAALEYALERVPAIVVCAVDLPIIDGARLAELLRSNPRARAIRLVFLVEDELDAPVALGPGDGIALAPWRDEDVVAAVKGALARGPLAVRTSPAEVARSSAAPEAPRARAPEPAERSSAPSEAAPARRASFEPPPELLADERPRERAPRVEAPPERAPALEPARRVPEPKVVSQPLARAPAAEPFRAAAVPSPAAGAPTEIEGELAQIQLADLLEMFHHGRKSGTIQIASERGNETVSLHEGQVIDARAPLRSGGVVRGEKALYRLLAARSGRFRFSPGARPAEPTIEQPSRALLLEGARQLDEWRRHRRELPRPEARVRLRAGRESRPRGGHAVADAVLDAAAAHPRVSDIVDHCSFPDYQVLRAIQDLLASQLLELEAPSRPVEGVPPRPASDATLAASQVRRLREWLAARRPRPARAAKVVVIPVDREAASAFVAALEECPDFQLQQPGERAPGAGHLGRFALGDGNELRIVLLPPGAEYQPLWRVAAHGLLGAAVVLRSPLAPGLERARPLLELLPELGARAVVPLVISGAPDPVAQEALDAAGLGPALVLGTDAGARRAVLQSLLGRIVP